MWEVIGIMIVGIFVGYAIRKKENAMRFAEKMCGWVIFLLLFALGLSVGQNNAIMNKLSELWLFSTIVALSAIAGSVVCAFLVYKYVFNKNKK